MWTTFAMLTFYTVNPVLPVPNQTNSTFLIFMRYLKQSVFTSMNGGDNNCETAYRWIWVFFAAALGIIILNFSALCIAIRAQFVRVRNASSRKIAAPLDHTTPAMVLCVLAAIFYLLMAGSKAASSITTLRAIQRFNVDLEDTPTTYYAGKPVSMWYGEYFFPFQSVTLDFATLLFVTSFMSIIRGYTTHSKSAFRLSAVTAAAFALVGYPPIIGGINFYVHNNFLNFTDCYQYFMQGK